MKYINTIRAVVIALGITSLQAATQGPFVFDVGPTRTDDSFVILLPKFNIPGQGLVKVSYDITAGSSGLVAAENVSPAPTVISMTLGSQVSIDLFPAVVVAVLSESFLASGFDGVIDYDGTSGEAFAGSSTESISGDYTGALALAPFNGPGTLPITIDGISTSSVIINSGNGEFFTATDFSASLSVTYTYQPLGRDPGDPPIIPETSTYLSALSLFGVGFLGWRRMQKSKSN